MRNLHAEGCCSRPIESAKESDESVRELSRCIMEASMSFTDSESWKREMPSEATTCQHHPSNSQYWTPISGAKIQDQTR